MPNAPKYLKKEYKRPDLYVEPDTIEQSPIQQSPMQQKPDNNSAAMANPYLQELAEQKLKDAYIYGNRGPKTEKDQNMYNYATSLSKSFISPYLQKKGGAINGSKLRRQASSTGLRTSKKHK